MTSLPKIEYGDELTQWRGSRKLLEIIGLIRFREGWIIPMEGGSGNSRDYWVN